MQGKYQARMLHHAALAACYVAFAGASPTAPAQGNASSPIQLQPYTAPDQSASAGVPPGWKVTDAAQTVINMAGPNQGETITLGRTFIARNAPFQPGQRAAGADLSMPYNATPTQKFTMIWQQGEALGGQPVSQVTFTSATPIQLPPALGQCGRFVASSTTSQGAVKLMGAFCSLPLDSGGFFKNILVEAQAPPDVAAKDAQIASAVFASYKVSQAMLQKKLAPVTMPKPAGGGGAMPGIIPGLKATDTFANCFDLTILRDTPKWQLPVECGGTKPD